MKIFLIVLVGLTLIGSLYVRFAPTDAETWHVDPDEAPSHGRQREKRIPSGTLGFDVDVWVLAAAIDKAAMAQPRTKRLAGGWDSLRSTYMQRTRLYGYPDFITFKATATEDGGSTLAVFSRSRFGRRDFGVNAARVKSWLLAIEQELSEQS